MMFEYLSGGLAALLVGTYGVMSYQKGNLKDELILIAHKLELCQRSNITKDISINDLNNSISRQNQEIEDIKIDYEQKLILYKKKNPKVIIKEIIKNHPVDIDLTRGSCEDTKNVIDAISSIDFNSL